MNNATMDDRVGGGKEERDDSYRLSGRRVEGSGERKTGEIKDGND